MTETRTGIEDIKAIAPIGTEGTRIVLNDAKIDNLIEIEGTPSMQIGPKISIETN